MRPRRGLKRARRLVVVLWQCRGGRRGALCCAISLGFSPPAGCGPSSHVAHTHSRRWVPRGAARGRRGGRGASPRPAPCLFAGTFLLSSPVRGSDGSGELAALLLPHAHRGASPRTVSVWLRQPGAAGVRVPALRFPGAPECAGSPRPAPCGVQALPRAGRPRKRRGAAGEDSRAGLLERGSRSRLQRGSENVRERF